MCLTPMVRTGCPAITPPVIITNFGYLDTGLNIQPPYIHEGDRRHADLLFLWDQQLNKFRLFLRRSVHRQQVYSSTPAHPLVSSQKKFSKRELQPEFSHPPHPSPS